MTWSAQLHIQTMRRQGAVLVSVSGVLSWCPVAISQTAHGLGPDVMDRRPQLFHNLSSHPGFAPLPNYTAWWQAHTDVNNLPKVVNRQNCSSRQSNWLASICECNIITRLTTEPPLIHVHNSDAIIKETPKWRWLKWVLVSEWVRGFV